MSQSPAISVNLPVYNAEKYVAQTIESILNQTFTEFEFLILNDGSSDRSGEILTDYAQKDARIRVFSAPNQGVSRSRNQLLHQSQGEWIAVMDADDIALPDRFALQLNYLRHHPEVVCVGGAHDLIDEVGRFLTHLALPETDAEIQRLALAGHGSICHPCALIRRSAMLQVGGYDETLRSAHDLDLWLKLGEIGQLANLIDPVLKYRIHTASVSGQNYRTQRDEARQACEQAWQRRGIEGLFEATDPWRPGPDRASQHHFALQYGWWAYNNQEMSTARHYAIRAIQTLPFNLKGWNLLRCTLLNH